MAQIKIGTVISAKMQKTLLVEVKTRVKHPLYKKMITKTKNFKVHNDLEVQIGRQVKIIETRPFSKDVHFKVLEVLK